MVWYIHIYAHSLHIHVHIYIYIYIYQISRITYIYFNKTSYSNDKVKFQPELSKRLVFPIHIHIHTHIHAHIHTCMHTNISYKISVFMKSVIIIYRSVIKISYKKSIILPFQIFRITYVF